MYINKFKVQVCSRLHVLCTHLFKPTSDARKPLSTIDENISVIKMPPTMRKRGRPKGAGLTVIGLPKKKGKTASTRPTAFVLKSEWEKTRGNASYNTCI